MRRRLLAAIVLSWLTVVVLQAVTYVSDTFTDTDGTDITAHTPDTGGTWLQHFTCASTLLVTDHNDIEHTTVDTGCNVYNNTSPSGAEYNVSGDLVYHSGSLDVIQLGVMGRVSTSEETFYVVLYSGFSGNWELYRVVSGTFTAMGTFNQALAGSTTYNVRLELTNATKKVFIDDVERISDSDNTITGTGHGGIYSYRETGSSVDTLHLDNFLVDDIAGGGGGSVKPKRLLLLGVGGK